MFLHCRSIQLYHLQHIAIYHLSISTLCTHDPSFNQIKPFNRFPAVFFSCLLCCAIRKPDEIHSNFFSSPFAALSAELARMKSNRYWVLADHVKLFPQLTISKTSSTPLLFNFYSSFIVFFFIVRNCEMNEIVECDSVWGGELGRLKFFKSHCLNRNPNN